MAPAGIARNEVPRVSRGRAGGALIGLLGAGLSALAWSNCVVRYPSGGHLWVGNQREVMAEVVGFLRNAA